MTEAEEQSLLYSLRQVNPWWDLPSRRTDSSQLAAASNLHLYMRPSNLFSSLPPRHACADFCRKVTHSGLRRIQFLHGPRGTGKTVILKQVIEELMANANVAPHSIMYAPMDAVPFWGIGMSRLAELFLAKIVRDRTAVHYIFFDEVQAGTGWPSELKGLFDRLAEVNLVAAGTADLQAADSTVVAGRFESTRLDYLSYPEFLSCRRQPGLFSADTVPELQPDLVSLCDYARSGAYPEYVANAAEEGGRPISIGAELFALIANDLRRTRELSLTPVAGEDLARLYYLIAARTGTELSDQDLSDQLGLSQRSVAGMLALLEQSGLLRRLAQVDARARPNRRRRQIMAVNSNHVAALIGVLHPLDPRWRDLMAVVLANHLVSLVRPGGRLCYGVWGRGPRRVDFVELAAAGGQPLACWQLAWDERTITRVVADGAEFCTRHNLDLLTVATRSASRVILASDISANCIPLAELLSAEFADRDPRAQIQSQAHDGRL